MRRDLCYFYPCPINVVYPAYVQAVKQGFGKDCRQEPNGKVISFGLNYSFKYNMNGGVCTITFMPYNNGTAINLRYTVVQAFGARYGKHAEDLTKVADGIIGVKSQQINLAVDLFVSYVNSGQPVQAPVQPNPQYVQQPPRQPAQPNPHYAQQRPVQQAPQYPQQPAQSNPQNAQQPTQQPARQQFCVACGKPLDADAKFCTGCGKPVLTPEQNKNLCPKCGREFQSDERFCVRCGTKNPKAQ